MSGSRIGQRASMRRPFTFWGSLRFIGWLALGSGWEAALTSAIAVLIITCPCALALAVPAVQVAASSRLFARGVVVKAADGLERLAEVDTVVFDKTGTLTLAEPQLVAHEPIADAVLGAAASLAQASRHPYARALVAAARTRGIELGSASDVKETAGAGLRRVTERGEERLGSASWCGIAGDKAVGADGSAASLWYQASDERPVPFHFEECLRPDAAATVRWLRGRGYRIELLSGDREQAVQDMARQAGIESARSGVRPDGKIARIDDLRRQGSKVLMLGDGLNDAPALAAAHASLSPATASDISQTAADAVFQGHMLAPVVLTLQVAQLARRMALQNFAIALAYNAAFVPLAVRGQVTPLIAAIAMSASSLVVTMNAFRLGSVRLEEPR